MPGLFLEATATPCGNCGGRCIRNRNVSCSRTISNPCNNHIYIITCLRSEMPNTATTKSLDVQVSGLENKGLTFTSCTSHPSPARSQSSDTRLVKKLRLVAQSVIFCIPRKTTVIDSSLAARKASVSWMAPNMDLFDTSLSALSKEHQAGNIGTTIQR